MRNRVVLVGNAALSLTKTKPRIFRHGVWQRRRDSNTQPAVLETAALPLSHSSNNVAII